MNFRLKNISWFIFFVFHSALFFSQEKELRIFIRDENHNLKLESSGKKFRTDEESKKEVKNVLTDLHRRGYLLATVDSAIQRNQFQDIYVSQNKIYRTAFLKLGNLNPSLASKIGVSEKLFFNKPFNYKEVANTMEKIISWHENNGYPFCSVKLDSVNIVNEEISAVLNVEKNKYFKIDSIKVVGTAKVNQSFFERYLSVKEKMPYKELVFADISKRIKQLPFVIEIQPQRVQLTERTNKLILFLDRKKTSQFDGIVGLLPDAVTKKTIFTADIKLKFLNDILKNGETVEMEFRRLKSQTLDLTGIVNYPYLFGTPIGIDYNVKIYRRDTTFIDVNQNYGLQYLFSGLNYFKVFYKQRNSSLISTLGYELVTALPDYADVMTQSYGMGIKYEDLNYRLNPRKGISININGQVGNRHIRKNPGVNPVAYSKLILSSAQYQSDAHIYFYLPIRGNNILKFGFQGSTIFGNSTIYRNELFRIGGLKTLRGFDEESIFASTYVIPTLEYRFLFAKNSNMFLFSDAAWYENNSNHKYVKDNPYSAGAGINIETKAGILTLTYALGSQFSRGFDTRSGKIHFGLISVF